MKAVFVDRDGVVNRFPGRNKYVTSLKMFSLFPQALEAIRLFTKNGFKIYIISNQGCISHKFITMAELRRITNRMKSAALGRGGKINQVYYCYHQTSDNCDCKKPKTGLFKRAVRGKKIDIASSYFIGDSVEDVLAGKGFGLRTILVLSGRTKKKELKTFPAKPDFIKKDLLEAAQWIIQKKF